MQPGWIGGLMVALTLLAGCAQAPQRQPPQRPASQSAEFAALQRLLGDTGAHAPSYSELEQAYNTQPDFACRQPAYAAYFQRARAADNRSLVCDEKLPLLMWHKEGAWQVRWVNPAQVRSVHLLFAGKSPALASRFGHVALRLVICPDLASTSEACAINVDEHLVLGFQAHVDDSQIQLRRAIFGGYHTRLMANRFFDTYEQYTTAEFRELYSLPLLMDSQEQQDFLHSLVQLHWSHESDYRFFTNNCATLLQDTLARLWPRYAQTAAGDQRFLRPDSFFAAMRHSGLLADDVLTDPAQAKRDGYWFSSNETAYRTAAQLLANAMDNPFFSNLENYAGTPAQQRMASLTTDTSLRNAIVTNPRLRATPLLLEEWALLQAERRMLHAAIQLWEIRRGDLVYKGDATLSASDQALIENCLTGPLRAQLTPPARHSGIPVSPAASTTAWANCNSTQKQQLQQRLLHHLPQASADWRQLLTAAHELAATLANLTQLRYGASPLPLSSSLIAP